MVENASMGCRKHQAAHAPGGPITDHRPEVRDVYERRKRIDELEQKLLVAVDAFAEPRRTWLKEAINEMIAYATPAPPIEPVGMREAVDKALREVASDLENRWCRNAHIILTAALAAQPQVVVEDVVTVAAVVVKEWGLGIDTESDSDKLRLKFYCTKELNVGDRIRVVAYKEQP